jgi:hypothetical protein
MPTESAGAGPPDDLDDELFPQPEDDNDPEQLAAPPADGVEEENAFQAMFSAGQRKDEENFERHAARYLDEASSEAERAQERFRVLAVRYLTGIDPQAITKLEEQATLHATYYPFIKNLVGLCHSHSGNLGAAEAAFREALVKATGDDKQYALTNLADTVVKAGRPKEAIEMLRDELRESYRNDDVARRLWEKVRSAAESDGDPVLAAVAKEKSTSYTANSADAQFASGYLYGEIPGITFSPATVHHYQQALSYETDRLYANNNMAIQLAANEMPITAIARYEADASKGDTLAMANLAQRYLLAGFAKEADELLRKAEQSDDPDARVALIRSQLNDAKALEAERFQSLIEDGQRQTEFTRRYADAWIARPTALELGAWADGRDLSISGDGEPVIKIAWRDAGRDQWYEFKQHGNALLGVRRKESYWGTDKVSDAYGFIRDDMIQIMSWPSGTDGLAFETIRRNRA